MFNTNVASGQLSLLDNCNNECYCRQDKSVNLIALARDKYLTFKKERLYITNNGRSEYGKEIRINYCPFCGRIF